ncbi:lactoylglutathione lyase [Chryseobacterium lacus]|uniref:Lactoylglutathione lyase n=1 Tax=Chryseobacterium lacus TaxID=2058346 RepID=A0A368MYY7_9FLAO|nr:VOC family protein [Chryseobacterium lacus]RCU43140.1 lactoylglutathione lyase [Chryseobacterium lacus]RST27988.1 lactoylglutathione lyase [Chryseobacterium lacus]
MFGFNKIHFILYVENQQSSTVFYEKIFRKKARLNVPGMSEFEIADNIVLGLMPNAGIAKILKDKMPAPETGTGIPRCELYLYSDQIDSEYENVKALNIDIISPLQDMNWGDKAFYFADPDGHIIVFAQKINGI